jgi:hypothetical protein
MAYASQYGFKMMKITSAKETIASDEKGTDKKKTFHP